MIRDRQFEVCGAGRTQTKLSTNELNLFEYSEYETNLFDIYINKPHV